MVGLTKHTSQVLCTVAIAWSSAFPFGVSARLPELADLNSRGQCPYVAP